MDDEIERLTALFTRKPWATVDDVYKWVSEVLLVRLVQIALSDVPVGERREAIERFLEEWFLEPGAKPEP